MVSVDAVVTTNKTSTSTAAVKQANMWSERSEVGAVAEVEVEGRMVGQQLLCYVVGCGWWWWL